MSSLVLTETQIQQFDILNKVLEGATPKLKNLTVDSIISEVTFINSLESIIPESTRFDLHLDMILENGTRAISDYYKGLSTGNNYILEAARKVFPDSKEITESIESFKKYLITLLTESDMTISAPVEMISQEGIDSAFNGGDLVARTGKGFWDTLKGLWNAVTEGGSTIGIIQFILDIIGVVGDWIFPAVGVTADIFNAIIYYIRGEYMLAVISLIAGVVIGGGDLLKGSKVGARLASPILVKLAKGEVDNAAEAVAKLGTKDSNIVMRLLRKIVSLIGGAVGSATTIFGKFIQNFGKVTGYIPGLGLALEPIFKFLGKSITNFGTKMTTFCDSFKLMDTKLAKEAIEKMETAANSGSTFKLSDDGKLLFAYSTEGKLIGKIPSETFMQSGIKKIRYGGASGSDKLFTTAADFAKYQSGIGKLATNKGFGKRFTAWATGTLPKGVKTSFAALSFFIGKQIWKIIHGTEWTGAPGQWNKREVEGHGNGAFNSWIDDQIKKKREETGAVYVPYIELDSSDKETYDKVLDYQNHFARLYGEPSLMNVVVDNYDKDKVDDEFDEFFNAIGRGDITREDSTKKETSEEPKPEENKIAPEKYGDNFVRPFQPTTTTRFSQFK